MSKNEVISDLIDIRHALWEADIPSPTVPEYIEHHKQIQELMALVDKKIDKYNRKEGNQYD